jgi:Clr5 domain
MAPSASADMPVVGRRARRRRARVLNWDEYRDRILHLYETENRPLREVCQIMRDDHGFDAT